MCWCVLTKTPSPVESIEVELGQVHDHERLTDDASQLVLQGRARRHVQLAVQCQQGAAWVRIDSYFELALQGLTSLAQNRRVVSATDVSYPCAPGKRKVVRRERQPTERNGGADATTRRSPAPSELGNTSTSKTARSSTAPATPALRRSRPAPSTRSVRARVSHVPARSSRSRTRPPPAAAASVPAPTVRRDALAPSSTRTPSA